MTITASIGDITQGAGNSGTWTWSFDTSDGPEDAHSPGRRGHIPGGDLVDRILTLARTKFERRIDRPVEFIWNESGP